MRKGRFAHRASTGGGGASPEVLLCGTSRSNLPIRRRASAAALGRRPSGAQADMGSDGHRLGHSRTGTHAGEAAPAAEQRGTATGMRAHEKDGVPPYARRPVACRGCERACICMGGRARRASASSRAAVWAQRPKRATYICSRTSEKRSSMVERESVLRGRRGEVYIGGAAKKRIAQAKKRAGTLLAPDRVAIDQDARKKQKSARAARGPDAARPRPRRGIFSWGGAGGGSQKYGWPGRKHRAQTSIPSQIGSLADLYLDV